MLARAGRLYAPKLFDYDRKSGRWLVEEYVPGERAKRTEAGSLLSKMHADRVYETAARMKPVLRRRSVRKWAKWLAEIDPDFPQPDKDAVWPEALIHSDLRGNLHYTPDGRLFVLDWELSRVAPVAADAASIYYLNPSLKPQLVAWLRHLDPEGKAPAPEIQIGFALMRFTSDMMENPAQYQTDLMNRRRISYEAAAALVEEDKNGIREHLAHLVAK
jgi:thiamine kinase-like enzyme